MVAIVNRIVDVQRHELQVCRLQLVAVATPEAALDAGLNFRAEYQLAHCRKLLGLLEEAVAASDVVALPEYSTSAAILEALGAGQGAVWEQLDVDEQRRCRDLAARLAAKIVIAGSYAVREGNRRYNRSPVWIYGQKYFQDKLHPTKRELEAGIVAGRELQFFCNTGVGDMAVVICYDFTDVNLLRGCLADHVDLVVVITRNRDIARFMRNARAEAYNCYAYLAIVNEAGLGGTVVYAPHHGEQPVAQLPGGEGLVAARCEMPQLELARTRRQVPPPFKTPPAGIHPRHLPHVEAGERSQESLQRKVAACRVTLEVARRIRLELRRDDHGRLQAELDCGDAPPVRARVAVPNSAGYEHARWRLAQGAPGASKQQPAGHSPLRDYGQAMIQVGTALWHSFFPEEMATALARVIEQCREQQTRPLLQIIAADPELLALPFELLYCPASGFVCLDPADPGAAPGIAPAGRGVSLCASRGKPCFGRHPRSAASFFAGATVGAGGADGVPRRRLFEQSPRRLSPGGKAQPRAVGLPDFAGKPGACLAQCRNVSAATR